MLKQIEQRLRQNSYLSHGSFTEQTPVHRKQNEDQMRVSNFSSKLLMNNKFMPSPSTYTHRHSMQNNAQSPTNDVYSSQTLNLNEDYKSTPRQLRQLVRKSKAVINDDILIRNRAKNISEFSQTRESNYSSNKQQFNELSKLNILEDIQNMVECPSSSASTNMTPLNKNHLNPLKPISVTRNQSSFTNSNKNNGKPNRNSIFLKQLTEKYSSSSQNIQNIERNRVEEQQITSNSQKSIEMPRDSLRHENKEWYQNKETRPNKESGDDLNCASFVQKSNNHQSTSQSNFSVCTSKQSYMNLIFNEPTRTMNQQNFQDYLSYLTTQPQLSQKSSNNSKSSRQHIKLPQSTLRQRRVFLETSQNKINQSLIQLNNPERSIYHTRIQPQMDIKDDENNIQVGKSQLKIKINTLNEVKPTKQKTSQEQLTTIDKILTPQLSQSSAQKIKTLINIPSISNFEVSKSTLFTLKPVQILKKKQESINLNKNEEVIQRGESFQSKAVQFITSIQNIDIGEDNQADYNDRRQQQQQQQPQLRIHKRHLTVGSAPLISLNHFHLQNEDQKSSIKQERSLTRNMSQMSSYPASSKSQTIIGQLKALNFAQKLILKKDLSKQTQCALNALEKMIRSLRQMLSLPKIFRNKIYKFLYDLWSRFPDLRRILLDKEKNFIRTPIIASCKQLFEVFKFEKLKSVYEISSSQKQISYDQTIEKYLMKDLDIYNTFIEEHILKIQQTQLNSMEQSIINQQNTINDLEKKMSQNLLCNPNQSSMRSPTYHFKQEYNNYIKQALENNTFLITKQAEKFKDAENKYGNFNDIRLNQKFVGSYIQKIYDNIRKNKINHNKFAHIKERQDDSF